MVQDWNILIQRDVWNTAIFTQRDSGAFSPLAINNSDLAAKVKLVVDLSI
jgi:hypothetical protein